MTSQIKETFQLARSYLLLHQRVITIPMREYGENDGPLGRAPDISVGVSDAVILGVSAVGFCMLAWSIYSIVLAKLKTRQELEKEAEEKEISYGEQLTRADVSTLNRAQRRARAKHIMKQQRKLGGGTNLAGVDGENHNIDDNNLPLLQDEQPHEENIPAWDNGNNSNTQNLLSRKERQKAAKQVELQERKILQEDRRNEQKKAQEAAIARRKAREAQQKIVMERERKEKQQQQQAEELERYRAWKVFLEPRNSEKSITVQEWIRELQSSRIVRLDRLAQRFGVEESAVGKRIQELLDTNRLCGILERSNHGDEGSSSRARFIYLSSKDMIDLASFVKDQDQFTPKDFASHISKQLPELSLTSSQ